MLHFPTPTLLQLDRSVTSVVAVTILVRGVLQGIRIAGSAGDKDTFLLFASRPAELGLTTPLHTPEIPLQSPYLLRRQIMLLLRVQVPYVLLLTDWRYVL